MGKAVGDVVLDSALNHIINNVDQLVLCETEPGSYSDATTDKGNGGDALGETAIGAADISGPTDGDTSGRKITVQAQSGITVDKSGTLDHVALVDDSNSDLLHVTTTSGRSVQNGDQVDTDAYDEEIEDPT